MPTASQDAIRIIVVDGIGASRQRLGRLLLPAEDIEVAALARSGAECLALASLLTPDVIVVAATGADDSLQVIERLKKNLPRLGVVLITASSDMDVLRAGLRAGARRVLPLPPKGEQLLAAIREAAGP
jgi:DNA-binding NarL/FixJ family response regulator